jgi:hypothetical protein
MAADASEWPPDEAQGVRNGKYIKLSFLCRHTEDSKIFSHPEPELPDLLMDFGAGGLSTIRKRMEGVLFVLPWKGEKANVRTRMSCQ